MKKLLCFIAITNYFNLFSQTLIINNQRGPNSAETELMLNNADYLNEKIVIALKEKQYDKAEYYIDRWVHNGAPDARLYILFSDLLLAQGKNKKAKRKLLSAHKRFGCYECKEMANKIKTTKFIRIEE